MHALPASQPCSYLSIFMPRQPARMLIKTQILTRGSTSWIEAPSPLLARCPPQTAHSWQTPSICDLLQQMVVPGHRPPVWTPPLSQSSPKAWKRQGSLSTVSLLKQNATLVLCLDQLGVQGACSLPAPRRASSHPMNVICECVRGFGF